MLYLKTLFLILFLSQSSAIKADEIVKTVNDLRKLKQQVETSTLPVLLMFTSEDCDYCEAIRKNYLLPMIRSGEYQSQILFRQFYIEEFNYFRDKNGELKGGDQLALKYDIDVTPTLIFIDAEWNELTDRITGINNHDYFDTLLSQSIAKAYKNFLSKK